MWFRGKETTILAPAEIARLGEARTFQNLRILGNMTALENVMVGRHRRERTGFVNSGLRLASQRREERISRGKPRGPGSRGAANSTRGGIVALMELIPAEEIDNGY